MKSEAVIWVSIQRIERIKEPIEQTEEGVQTDFANLEDECSYENNPRPMKVKLLP